jgi:hypothetical protein
MKTHEIATTWFTVIKWRMTQSTLQYMDIKIIKILLEGLKHKGKLIRNEK